jgi:hypothetical protein
MTVSKKWCELDKDLDKLDLYTNKHDVWNLALAHHKEEDNICSFTTMEIAEVQPKDQELKVYFRKNARIQQKDIGLHLIEDTRAMQEW